MDKLEIYKMLEDRGIEYKFVNHPPAFTVDDLEGFKLPEPEFGAKNLFLRDDKKKNFYLLTLPDKKPVNIKEFQEKARARRLSFASPEYLMQYLGITPGSVSPFCLFNNKERNVKFYIDSYFKDSKIAIHPNDNTATVYLETCKLLELIAEHGTKFEFIDI